MNYAKIKKYDVANGEGLRVSIFFSGCKFKCKGCFNKEAQDFNYGSEYTKYTKYIILGLLQSKTISGLSLLGGEVMQQDIDKIVDLVKSCKEMNPKKTIWLWTGYKFENLNEDQKRILPYIDVLVDGQFEEDKKDLNLKWRGSSNQRVIDVQKTLENNKIILYCE